MEEAIESKSRQRKTILNDRFMLNKHIEKGGFGSVFLATDLQNMCEVIIKFNS